MQIDTHFNDFTNDVIDNDRNDKILDKVLGPRQELQKILQYCPKKLKKWCFDDVQRLTFIDGILLLSPYRKLCKQTIEAMTSRGRGFESTPGRTFYQFFLTFLVFYVDFHTTHIMFYKQRL